MTATNEAIQTENKKPTSSADVKKTGGRDGGQRGNRDNRRGGRDNRRGRRGDRPKKEFNEVLLEIRRVTKVTRWGRRMNFRATILIGNGKGKIGVGVAKWSDVAIAVRKATHDAYKHISIVPITEEGTIPYPLTIKNKASVLKLIPAAQGTGMKAWSSVRMVLELAGYSNMLSKIIGTNNKLNNALTTIKALTTFKNKRGSTKKVKAAEDKKAEKKTSKKAK